MDGFMDALVAQPSLALCVVLNGGGGGGEGGAAGGGGAGAAPQPLQLELALRGKLYFYFGSGSLSALDVPTSGTVHTVVSGGPLAPHKTAFPGAVAAALEGWLYLAGRLGLVALVRLLLDFYKAQLVPTNVSLLSGAVAKVYSRRVLECMPHELLVEGFVSSCLNDPHTVQAEVDSGSKLSITLTAPEAASALGHKPSMVESATVTRSNLLVNKTGATLLMRLSVGGLDIAEQRRVLKEVLQRLEEEEEQEAEAPA
ncbi:hypothetical protein CHLRE_07g315000v5 [Chlamydomonas reinhardtii]|uniref:Uncharacterized protein n=1 Tax=Chlamydomonas reinhardtii TaxID=3055 RepID=A0A2K3DIL9_CHLRE|nr:uncharacterized protein CHLRE_07g315000v5 [Chlamydomonas reinhardtii]PNW80377.1 hypothetical protein CHLRE_07g315000v5 [Chlamydomonas reinhardtii]